METQSCSDGAFSCFVPTQIMDRPGFKGFICEAHDEKEAEGHIPKMIFERAKKWHFVVPTKELIEFL